MAWFFDSCSGIHAKIIFQRVISCLRKDIMAHEVDLNR